MTADELDDVRERKREAFLQRAAEAGDQAARPVRMLSEPVHIGEKVDLEQLVSTHRIVLVDFHADWCGPCKMLEPTVRELAQHPDVVVAKVDVDALPALAEALQIQGVPTVFLFVDGDPVERLVGVQDYGTLASLVERYAA